MLMAGQSFTQMKEITSSLDMPCCSKDTFYHFEKKLWSTIHDAAWLKMEAAAKEEACLAMAAGAVDEAGIPLIAVVTCSMA
ncbi:hypothetical protein PR048_031850 [Dryococelus australis]|uniref:Mutator-like transposase domain-containing protein n=1 Tax=Dryococelus australis TaxID=614101 RepID=A0ABQ9G6H1_9NEOP|nr:hypothetical protein PR048_031850 [Dryococelus australis]